MKVNTNINPECVLICWYTGQIDMLKFPLASTGERFGVVRRFQPFIDKDLERERRRAVTQPRSETLFPH